jgi:hypothetical protein
MWCPYVQNADVDSARLPGVISAKQPRRWFELIDSTRFTDLREDISSASAFCVEVDRS